MANFSKIRKTVAKRLRDKRNVVVLLNNGGFLIKATSILSLSQPTNETKQNSADVKLSLFLGFTPFTFKEY
jgi:hypothetical protein